MKTNDSDAARKAEELAERKRRSDALKTEHPEAKGLLKSLFSSPAPAETPVARTLRQLKEARKIAAREYNCRPEDVGHEVVASIAQTLAINEQTVAVRAANK